MAGLIERYNARLPNRNLDKIGQALHAEGIGHIAVHRVPGRASCQDLFLVILDRYPDILRTERDLGRDGIARGVVMEIVINENCS